MNLTAPKLDFPHLLLRPVQAAKALSISVNTLDAWVAEYGIECIRIKGQRYFPVEALQRFIAERQAEAEQRKDDGHA